MTEVLDWLEQQRARLRHLAVKARETLWVQPLAYGLVATVLVSVGRIADATGLQLKVDIGVDVIETLLSVLTASMLGVATFAVASMVSAYASVGAQASPRAFNLIVADDVSKQALSAFVAAFVYATVGMIAVRSQTYGTAGRLVLFVTTLAVYFGVVLTFLRWVDSIARLGRVGGAIARVEEATREALTRTRRDPHHQGVPPEGAGPRREVVMGEQVGYVPDIDMACLQAAAVSLGTVLRVHAVPGTFVGPGVPLLSLDRLDPSDSVEVLQGAFFVGRRRNFERDPGHGLGVLAEIAARALSPGVNDPATAIEVLRAAARLLVGWAKVEPTPDDVVHDQVEVPQTTAKALFEAAFDPVIEHHSGSGSVARALQETFTMLASTSDADVRAAASEWASAATEREC